MIDRANYQDIVENMAGRLPEIDFANPYEETYKFANELVNCNPKRPDVLSLAGQAFNAGVTNQESLRQIFPGIDRMNLQTTPPKSRSFSGVLHRVVTFAAMLTHH